MNKPRPIPSLTSPGSPGAFLFPNAAPFDVPAFVKRMIPAAALPAGRPFKAIAIASPLPRAAALPAALSLCPVRQLPPRHGAAAGLAASGNPCRRPSAGLSLPLSRRFPCPVPPVNRAGIGKPRPPARPPLPRAACRPEAIAIAAAAGSNSLPRPPVPAARLPRKGGNRPPAVRRPSARPPPAERKGVYGT